jgi:esterase/lipase
MTEPISRYAEEARRVAQARCVAEQDLPFARIQDGVFRPPCVLVHGSTATPRQMTWLADRLAGRGHAVLAPLLPGHGVDRGALAETTPHECLEELGRAVTACLNGGAVPFLVGYSFGAVLATWYAATGTVAGVVSLAGGCRPRIPVHGWLAMPWPTVAGALPCIAAPSRAAVWKLRVARFARALSSRSRELRVPLLVWHSLNDRTMLPSGSLLVFREARASYKQLLLTEGPGHPLSRSPELDEVAEAVIRFVERDHTPREVLLRTSCAGARRVEVAGSFNSWHWIPLSPAGDGTWQRNLSLTAGSYEYAFVVDGRWQPDTAAPSGTRWPDGRCTSLLEVV